MAIFYGGIQPLFSTNPETERFCDGWYFKLATVCWWLTDYHEDIQYNNKSRFVEVVIGPRHD